MANSEDLTIENFIASMKFCHPSFLSLKCDKEILLDNYNYILTNKAQNRLDKLYTYISNGIPVLLEGETGTSKTLSAEIICKHIFEIRNKGNDNIKYEDNYIKFNLSAEVKISDLIQKFMGEKNSLSGLEIVDGPFVKAFKKGIPLILDEINLASEEVLQCIEEALDSGEINIEISGIGNVHCKKKDGFCLIATQNPNRDNYINKRQHLSKSFLSHFQIIKFPPFEIEELKEIAENLFKSFNNNKEGDEKDKQFISDLINFHKEWTSQDERKNEIACFTIREIAATVKAYIDEGKKNPFKIVKVIYASRYTNEIKLELFEILGKYDTFEKDYLYYLNNGSKFQIPQEIEGFYENEILKDVLESSLFSLEKRRNILIVGECGIGKSHIAREIAKIYNLKKNKKGNNYCHFICTEETKCSDLIGYQKPKDENGKNIYMEWNDGILTKAIEKGEIVILDNLQEANSTVTERLNGLLDIKYDEDKKKGTSKKFDIPENPLKNSIEIHKDFRIIGICDIHTIIQMSPAFLNRFDIIVMENQLNIFEENDLVNLIKIILSRGKEKSALVQEAESELGDDFAEKEEEKEEDFIKKEILEDNEIEYLSSKLIALISNDQNNKENNSLNKSLSLSDISRLCYSIKTFFEKIGDKFGAIPKTSLIDFLFELHFSNNDIKINNNEIKKVLLNSIDQKYEEYQKKENNKKINFIYKDKGSLENFLCIIYASYLINLHLCIIGPPGVGKTTISKFISEILQNNDNKYKFFPFNRNTKTTDLYGTLNLKNQKLEHYNGPLIIAAKTGCIFIADEMNLSSISTMKSMVPVLDPLLNKNILIPGINEPIDIDDNYFFLVCQNDLDNLGRNCVPEMLQRKLRNINYPKQKLNEIKEICRKKRLKEFGDSEEFTEKDSELLGEFMKEYNDIIDKYKLPLMKWSFRDIDKIIKRIFENIRNKNFKNFKYFHFIYFYLLSPIPNHYYGKTYENKNLKDILHSSFIEIFHLKEISNELLNNYFEMPKADLENNYLMKGNIGIKFDNLAKMFQEELPNYYNDLFKLKLISNEEPILLMGPSSYKTHLATYFIKEMNYKNLNIIYLNQKTTVEELLGCSKILPPNSYMYFYDLIKNITNYEEDGKNDMDKEIANLKDQINKYKDKKQTKKYEILNCLYDNLKDYNEKRKKNNSENIPQIVFKLGSILLSILKEESIIFKNIHEVSMEIFERFNELFSSERILSINEDIHGTLFKSKNEPIDKSINLKFLDNIYFFATCPEDLFQSISESIISRFSVISVGEHGEKEKEKIIKIYSRKCKYMTDLLLSKIFEKFHEENFKNIKKIKNLIDIFNIMNENNIEDSKQIQKINNNLNYIMHFIKLNNNLHFFDISKSFIKEENPLIYENGFIISKISNLKIYVQNIDEKKISSNIIFTPISNEMIDLLHFGICTGTPIIFDGSPGQGKRKIINYICNLLNYDIENIIITKNFSVDDLFKKTILESKEDGKFFINEVDTKLYQILTESGKKHNQKHVLFIFHNLHKASADVLSKISNIFNNNKCKDSNYSLIGIINIKESIVERNTYYFNYFYKSIYYIIESQNIDASFCKKVYPFEDIDFSVLNYFNNTKNDENNFTLSDFNKFISLKKCSHFDDMFLEEIIFKNRFYLNGINHGKNNSDGYLCSKQKYNLDLNYKNQTKELLIELNDKSFSLESMDILSNFEFQKNTLSFEQKKCLIVLGLSVKSKIPCIIKGPTGVGKSHLVKLFSKILGKKLNIIVLNKDNDISLLTKRNIYKNYDKDELNEIEEIIDKLLENEDDIYKLNLKEKIIKLNNTKLESDKRIKYDELKAKFKFIHRFKYEKSKFLKAVENGEWILLDGIENAPSSIIERVTLLCGEKPELNLFESGQKPIYPEKGFHLFMTYNPDRINHNDPLPNILSDKCLIFNLDSFINNDKEISQIIYGFLINLNYSTDIEFLSNIASKISCIQSKIKKELENESEKISERTIIKFCKNFKFSKDNLNIFSSSIKNNFLYFYFPSSDMEKYEKIIDDVINEKGTDFIKLAKNYRIECKEPLGLLSHLEKNIENNTYISFNIGEFLSFCLNIPFEYLKNLEESINEVIRKANDYNYKGFYLPLKSFLKYIEEINYLLENNKDNINKINIRNYIDFANVRILLLFEKLYNNNLLCWNCIDLLYQNNKLFKTILELIKEQNLDNLEEFLYEIRANIIYIEDIIKLFPYSYFNETKFSLLNEILLIIFKNTARKKLNFKISIKSKEFWFNYIEKDNENISILLDLNLNEENELIITNETKIIVFSILSNKLPVIRTEQNEYTKLNGYYLMLIEKIANCEIFDKKSFKNNFIEIKKKLKDRINPVKEDLFEFKMLFKNDNNLIVNIWSLIFLDNKFKIYLDLLLKKIEKNVFEIINLIKKEILQEQPNTFNDKLNKIIGISKDLFFLLDKNSYIINLSKDENYIINLKNKATSELDLIQIKKDIKKEIDDINCFIAKYNDFTFLKEYFLSCRKLLENENLMVIKEINKFEILDFKGRIENKIKYLSISEKLKDIILKDLNEKDTFEKLKEFDSLVDNYLVKYNNSKEQKKIKIFSEKFFDDILKEKENNNVKTLELLLKYSEIKDIIDDIFTNNKNKLLSLKKLNELIPQKYLDFFNTFLIQDCPNNPSTKGLVNSFLNSMLIQELINNSLIKNFLEIKKLLNHLYDIDNSEKIDKIWCINIEKKYNLSINVYMPDLDDLSFINLFIKVKNIKRIREKGFLIEADSNYDFFELEILNKIFQNLTDTYDKLILKQKDQLILSIGNIIYNCIINKKDYSPFNDLISLDKAIQCYIENELEEKDKIKKQIMKNFLSAKELYLNYKNEEVLILDDIEGEKDRKKLFTNKYPSLLNYLNCNQEIYKNLIEEPEIFNAKYPPNSIPLWLICLRNLANSKYIKPFFEDDDDIINNRLETEFQAKIIDKLKNQYKDIYWTLLISPNYIEFIKNECYERLFRFFNFLLNELTLLAKMNKDTFYEIIKNFIFGIFDVAYDKGTDYMLENKIELFNLSNNLTKMIDEYKEKKFKEFYQSKSMESLKTLLEVSLDNKKNDSLKNSFKKLKNDVKNFEKQYNIEFIKNKIESEYSNMINICDKYNNLIDKYKNNTRSIEEINDLIEMKNKDIQIYIDKKDVNFINENTIILNNESLQKVEYLPKNKYMDKYTKIYLNNKFIYFEDIKMEEIEKEFTTLIEDLSKFFDLIKTLNKANINELTKHNKFTYIIEKKMKLLHINNKFNPSITEKISKEFNIDIEIIINKILIQINNITEYIKSIFNELNKYKNDRDTFILEYMKNETNIYIPKKEDFKQISNNNDEYILIKNESEIIPYYTIENDKIIGSDEIKYDLGTLSLNDSEYQNIYFASFEENILLEEKEKGEGVDIIKKNKLLFFRVKIKEKKEEKIEKYNLEGIVKFSYKGNNKLISYKINYQLKAMKIYLKCDKYKLRYLGKSLFKLNTPILFNDETINFTIRDINFNSKNANNNFKINLKSFENNTCEKPIKIKNKDGFSLLIKSNPRNNFLSCLLTIIICQRFQFQIKIICEVKQFDFDFLISQNKKQGFLDKEIYCPFDKQDEFDFIIYIGFSNERFSNLEIEKDYNENLIKMTEITDKSFIKSLEIKFHIKLLKKEETNVKLRAKVNNMTKELTIVFTLKSNCKNYGYKFIDNEIKSKDDNCNFFVYTFSELAAHGKKTKDKLMFMNNNEQMKSGFIDLSHLKTSQILKLEEINYKINNININNISHFYNRIAEEARLLPIYCLNYKNDESSSQNQKILKKNLHILEEIYDILTTNGEEYIYNYCDNYFNKEIREFISAYNYLNSIIEIKDKSLERFINKFEKYFENKNNFNSGTPNWFAEKFSKIKNHKKLKEFIKKYNINIDNFDPEELNKMKLSELDKNEEDIKNENLFSDCNKNKKYKLIIKNENNINNSKGDDEKDNIEQSPENKNNINNQKIKMVQTQLEQKGNQEDKILNNDGKNEITTENKNEDEDKIQITENNLDSMIDKDKLLNEEENAETLNNKNNFLQGNEASENKNTENKFNKNNLPDIFKLLLDFVKEGKNGPELMDKILREIRNDSIFLKKDIWKQNENSNTVSTQKIKEEEDIVDNYLNNRFESQAKLFSNNEKINSLEDIKRDIRRKREKLQEIKKDPLNENQMDSLEPSLNLINFGKSTFIPDKESLNDKKHEFENLLNDKNEIDEKNELNNTKEIFYFVRNKQLNIYKPTEEKIKFIEKNFEDDKNKKIKFQISFEENEEYFCEFDEQLINKIISNIKEKENEDKSFKTNIEPPIEPKNIRQMNIKNDNKEYIIKNLVNFSKPYMEQFLELISKSKLNFKKTSFCFIIDCSLYLGIKVKLFNLMLILSMIKLFYIIDIKFSIVLSADDKYKVIIKKYSDFIEYDDLIEILYETIIIKRFRNNILKTLETIIEFFKNDDENMNVIYFTLFDCMDESFTYPNYWLKKILNNKSNYFILVAEKSRLYKENNKEIINNMKKKFEEEIYEKNLSKVKFIDINLYNHIDDIDSIIKSFFSETFEFLKDIDDLKIQSDDSESLNLFVEDNKTELKINKNDKKNYTKNLEYFEEIIKDDFYKKYDQIYFINNLRPKSKIHLTGASNKKKEIEIPKYEKKDFPKNSFLNTLLKNSFQDRTLIESIFYPNKATQKQLSTKGTEIDIMALILYTLRPVQEPMIYLENKGGLIRDYSITIILDNSKSCFSELNERHSFQTLINLFHIINLMAVPSFDIILTTNEGEQPDILLFDKPSVTIFKNYSILEKLLTFINNPILNTDLSGAIRIVYELKRMKKNDRDSYLFILTDGLSYRNNEERIKINYFSQLCQNIGIKIFGIGIGIFPFRAKDLFDTFIYSVNPENLLKGISKIFGKIIKTESELQLISNSQRIWNLDDLFNLIKENDKFYFEELRKELQDIEKGDDVFDIFGNSEKNINDKIPFVEKGENLEIYGKNILYSQKILMVMFWSFDLNKKNESPYVSPKYINKATTTNGGVCIKSAISHFGIKNVIVVDYESAIKELLKKNEKGECIYYSVWIFCGPQYAVFPPINGEKNKSNPNLVEEFINILIEFWKNGGALVFMADGDPLNFQVNLFLDKIDFSENEKPNFRIHGDYKGSKFLVQDKEGKLDKVGVFNKSNHKINYKGKEIQRQSLSHNLGLIYEGYTISYAVDKLDQKKKITYNESNKLLPFKPFAINSEGGISTLLYEADSKGRGDILIDCGYTKCFFNMYRTGTYRFIQNIAGWTARPEIKFLSENIKPCDWRPKAIEYKVNYKAKYNGFLKLENENSDLSNMKTLFCIDDSLSTHMNEFYFNEIKDIIDFYYTKNRGDIFYFWNSTKQKVSYYELEVKIKSKFGYGDTYPHLIAEIIEEEKENKCRHLVIITDGCVPSCLIDEADEKMKSIDYNFDYVTVYILGFFANLSVGAPFCRNTPNKTFRKLSAYDNYREEITLSEEDIETLEHLNDYENFEEFKNNYDKIYKAVQAKCIGTSDLNLKNKLEIMFSNILKNNENIDLEFINKRKNILLGMTEGSIKNAFTLDQINAATCNVGD